MTIREELEYVQKTVLPTIQGRNSVYTEEYELHFGSGSCVLVCEFPITTDKNMRFVVDYKKDIDTYCAQISIQGMLPVSIRVKITDDGREEQLRNFAVMASIEVSNQLQKIIQSKQTEVNGIKSILKKITQGWRKFNIV